MRLSFVLFVFVTSIVFHTAVSLTTGRPPQPQHVPRAVDHKTYGSLPVHDKRILSLPHQGSRWTRQAAGNVKSDDIIVFQDDFAEADEAQLQRLADYNKCGVSGKKLAQIKGAGVSNIKDWPWIAAIIRKSDKLQFCGGAILTKKHILTAAHCVPGVDAKKIQVRVGEYDFLRTNDSYHQDLDVKQIYSHKKFDGANYEHDIAMLVLEKEMQYSFYVQPLCLPPPGPRYENMTCVVAGWGALGYGGPKSDVLMEVPVPTWEHQRCVASYVQTIFDTNVCAASYEGGKDSCQGDSGGPLMCQLDNSDRWSTIGIVSWGIRCGVRNKPGVYTRVNSYLPWISKHLEIQ